MIGPCKADPHNPNRRECSSGRQAAVGALACGLLTLATTVPVHAHPHVFVANEVKAVFEAGALTALRYRWVFDEMYTASATEGLDKNNDGKLDAAELDELLKVNIEGLKEFEYFTTATQAGQQVQFGDAKDFGLEVVAVDEPPGPQMLLGPSSGPADTGAAATTSAPPPRTVWGRISAWWSGLTGSKPPAAGAAPAAQTKAGGASSAAGAATQPPAQQKAKVLALQFTLPLKAPLAADSLPAGAKGFQFQVTDPQMFIAFEPAGPDAIGLAAGAPAQCRHALVEPNLTDEQRKLAEAFARVGGMAQGGFAKASAVICAAP